MRLLIHRYAVHSGPRLTHGVSGFCVTIVSAKHPADFLVAAVETFLAECEGMVEKMSKEEFEGHKASLVGSKMQKDRCVCVCLLCWCVNTAQNQEDGKKPRRCLSSGQM